MRTSKAPAGVSPHPSIALRFPPRRGFVARVTTLVRQFCRELLGDGDALSRVNMVVHELVENLVKYSAGGMCELSVEVAAEGATRTVRIEASNDVGAEEAEQLQRFLIELQDAADPVAFYDRTIQASAKRRHGSGLGLARIRAEGEMELSHRIAGGRISIVAEAALTEAEWAS